MCTSPNSLQDQCLEFICDNLPDVFEVYYVPQTDCRQPDMCNYEKRYRFRDKEMFLFSELSEMLLDRLVEKHILCDATISIFSQVNTCLRRVRVTNTRKLTFEGLKILQHHKIQELECVNVRDIPIDRILASLNPWSVENLKVFNVPRCTFIDMNRFTHMVQLVELKNLKVLNVSYTELNQMTFEMLCQDLKFLEKFDISGTCVKNLEPLLVLADQLTSLGLRDIKLINLNYVHLLKMHSLRHLDLAIINEKFDMVEDNVVKAILENPQCLKNLISLDVSGWKNVFSREAIEEFHNTHPKLRFIGLIMNAVAHDPMFTEPAHENYRRDLTVAGLANEEQICVSLKCHYDKPFFIQKALYHLFQITGNFKGARSDMLELVLSAMKEHPTKFGVQVAATACLYNLTRSELSKSIHPKLLGDGVNLILNAMENFPDEYQLQKNSLLNLCSDRILQEVNFDKFRCAKLVLDSLCAFDEINMNRMAVAICSILAAKVSTAETSELGARPVYMRKLLAMVQSRVEMKQSDITMKFTLSALWNLTDESAATCYVFLEQGGATLFLNVLQTFREDNAIETKVLGLLNNIAEVELLRKSLMIDTLMNELFLLLKSEHIDVSYFAAGIVAHLASDGEDKWTVKSYTRREMLNELETAVTQWKVPDNEMVAYRSFTPFFPLLRKDMDYQVQLWAVWAVYHVCNKNPKRYCTMLAEERGVSLLRQLLDFEGSHPTIRRVTSQILDILDMYSY